MPPAVTPSGVRDGDPAALAGLCAVRGPSVLAYCRQVAGEAEAGNAAAEAFASFRAAVVATDDLAELNPEALLISATRTAAASHAPHPDMDVCAVVPLLLADRANRTISAAEREILEQHVETCWHCRAPVARFEAAERAYRDPADPAIDPAIVTQIIAAMAAAAPLPAAALNGSAHAAPAGEAQPAAVAAGGESKPAAVAAGSLDEPTTEFRNVDAIEPQPSRPAPDPPPATAARSQPDRSSTAAPPAAGAAPRGSRIPRAKRPAAVGVPQLRTGRGGSRSRVRSTRPPQRGRSRSRSGLRLPIVLPIVVVLIALMIALFVAGVFGGGDPASSPRVDVPADVPAQDKPADVVVVPGAKQASSDAVEKAKARDRERERARRKREAAATRAAATDSSTPLPAAATSPPAAPVTAPPPPPPAAPKSGSPRKVDPGTGATGAEQIPSAADTSTVPDLAPAPETATAP